MARTATRGTGGLAGGMRGSKANELIVVQPRPSFWTVMTTNACRLLGRLLLWATRHPGTAGSLVLAVVLWLSLGLLGLTALLGCAAASLTAWRWLHPVTFRRVVVSRWRGVWVYRRCWQPAMHTCGLSVELHGREYLPRVRRVVAGECVDQVTVDLLSGQSPEQFETAVSQLAHTFAASRCRVVVEKPGRIRLESKPTLGRSPINEGAGVRHPACRLPS